MKTGIYAIAGGILVALLTGLLVNTPPLMVGAIHYGYPLPWLTRLIVSPQYFPWYIDYGSLIADIILWAIIVGVVLFGISRARRK